MPFFMLQWRYSQPAMKALVDRPQDRTEAARTVIEGYGGRLHQFFLAFGDHDGVAITEFPDNEAATACLLTLNAAGGFASSKTTVLITAEEATAAMRRANATSSGYQPPQG